MEQEIEKPRKQRRSRKPANPFPKRSWTWVEGTSFRGGPLRSPHAIAAWSIVASLIDALVLVGINALLLMVLVGITRENPLSLRSFDIANPLLHVFFGQVLLSSWCYMVILRSFMGSSLGEWACYLRLGREDEFMKSNYTLRVLFRCTLILATGLIPLPLISAISGQDCAGAISGLQIQSLK